MVINLGVLATILQHMKHSTIKILIYLFGLLTTFKQNSELNVKQGQVSSGLGSSLWQCVCQQLSAGGSERQNTFVSFFKTSVSLLSSYRVWEA